MRVNGGDFGKRVRVESSHSHTAANIGAAMLIGGLAFRLLTILGL